MKSDWLLKQCDLFTNQKALFFSLNRIFFPANEKRTLKQNSQSYFKACLKQPIKLQENERQKQAIVWRILQLISSEKFALFQKKKKDEFNYLQFLNDPNELLQAQDQHFGEFPTFSLYFDKYFGDFPSTSAQDPCDPETSKTETNENHTTANPEPAQEVDVSRFRVVSSDAMQELKSIAVNKNTMDECIHMLLPVPPS